MRTVLAELAARHAVCGGDAAMSRLRGGRRGPQGATPASSRTHALVHRTTHVQSELLPWGIGCGCRPGEKCGKCRTGGQGAGAGAPGPLLSFLLCIMS